MNTFCFIIHVVTSAKQFFCPFYGLKRTSYPDWQKTYETLSEMVVPRSTKWVKFNNDLKQCFPNLSWRTPSPAHFVCFPYLTHLIHVLQSLLTSWWVESGVLEKGDIQNVQGYGSSRTGLGSTDLKYRIMNFVLSLFKSWHHYALLLLDM